MGAVVDLAILLLVFALARGAVASIDRWSDPVTP